MNQTLIWPMITLFFGLVTLGLGILLERLDPVANKKDIKYFFLIPFIFFGVVLEALFLDHQTLKPGMNIIAEGLLPIGVDVELIILIVLFACLPAGLGLSEGVSMSFQRRHRKQKADVSEQAPYSQFFLKRLMTSAFIAFCIPLLLLFFDGLRAHHVIFLSLFVSALVYGFYSNRQSNPHETVSSSLNKESVPKSARK